ncbi:MAG: damage-inducible protein DinB [Flavipsychrobacter sp.]|nr:damage-inducible protein DinB [Flavipsychrobacter sp.]
MNDTTFTKAFIKELEAETMATHKCLERFNMDLFNWKPHETSMQMGYLALLCAEIPLWIAMIVKTHEIDIATFNHLHPKTVQELVDHFNTNLIEAKSALLQVEDDTLDAPFSLKANGKVMSSGTKRENLEPTINHLVHHRGQLTVYMRMNGIAIPSIYGPSADEKGF